MTVLTGSRHLGDDDLLRYMDHELDHEGMRLSGVHLRTCDDCSARLDALKQRSALTREWLSLLPGDVPDASRRDAAQAAMERARFRGAASGPMGSGWMKAAAAIVLAFGLGLATEPGRAFVAQGIVRAAGRDPGPVAARMVEWLGERRQLDHGLAVAPAEVTLPPQLPSAAASEAPARAAVPAARPSPAPARLKPGMSAPVRFLPTGPDFAITFASVQPAGTAQLIIREAPQASAQATRRYRGEELVGSPAGLQVRNGDRSRADYTIIIPARYRYIRVRVGDGPEAEIQISKDKQDGLWSISLQNSTVEPPDSI